MDTTMDLDELKQAWQTLDKRLEQQTAINRHLFIESRVDKAKARLRPLLVGQLIQLAAGIALTMFFAQFWIAHTDSMTLLLSGLLMHAWSVLLVVSAVMELLLITRLNYAAPVLTIQRTLAYLRTWRTRMAPWLGLPFWLLWMPLMAVVFQSLFGVEMHANVFWCGIPIGIAGLLATLWFHRWSHRPERHHLGAAIDAGSAGHSVTRAQAFLDEIASFERE
ncbi:MAG: hypothetical protein H7Y19_15475 [Luteimonas sp.]|nr:hypothetical protein [Luteimonas sp.]